MRLHLEYHQPCSDGHSPEEGKRKRELNVVRDDRLILKLSGEAGPRHISFKLAASSFFNFDDRFHNLVPSSSRLRALLSPLTRTSTSRSMYPRRSVARVDGHSFAARTCCKFEAKSAYGYHQSVQWATDISLHTQYLLQRAYFIPTMGPDWCHRCATNEECFKLWCGNYSAAPL